ncbi:MAG: methyltransferase [Rhodospirillales bacterium]|jgi:tRNA1(Val) A37 N6-methylase TrmN6|nr:methyltransferase [Rhodospirillales bacterium]
MAIEISTDLLLGGRIVLNQSLTGYRAAIDPVLLAAAVDVREGERVLDMGCGTGAAALCLAARMPEVNVDGLENMPQMAQMAMLNVEANGFGDRVKIIEGDVAHPPDGFQEASYDHVMANPPYRVAGSGNNPKDHVKAAAMVEGAAGLDAWVTLSWNILRRKGTLTLVHRADRLGDILVSLSGRFGGVVIFPLWPGSGDHHSSRRVIVRATKGVNTPLSLTQGLLLHGDTGAYTSKAEAILRGGKALNLGA